MIGEAVVAVVPADSAVHTAAGRPLAALYVGRRLWRHGWLVAHQLNRKVLRHQMVVFEHNDDVHLEFHLE